MRNSELRTPHSELHSPLLSIPPCSGIIAFMYYRDNYQSNRFKDCDTLLISIKPELVERIIAGEKKYEYRKSFPPITVKRLIIYSTFPIQRVVAIAEVLAMRENTPWAIWEGTKDGSGVSEKMFYEYFTGRTKAFAFKLGAIQLINPPVILKSVDRTLSPPQSYKVLTPTQTELFTRLVEK